MVHLSEIQRPIVPEADADLYNDEEDYASASGGSSTSSLTSTIVNYQYENGRRYHAYRQGEYMIPNDEREQERLDLHHHICNLALGGALYRAPIKPDIKRILDLGTGTGVWAIDVADQFPDAIITGTDLSPIQPTWVPPNCRFEIDDYELDWNFSQPFEYIHMRGIEGSVKDFQKLFKQANDNLTRGGWFEICDFTVGVFSDDDTAQKATSLQKWRDLLVEASGKFGKQFSVAGNYKQWMADAGFTDVHEEIYKVPFSPWPKNPKLKSLGRFHQANMLEALEAYSLALMTRFLGWTVDDVQVLLAGVRKELQDRTLHIYSRLYVVYGQKE
ncbi:S-adenosyl-L-methionine-dependent methyltransferase [Aspergillus karnatakaensis]|uniref:class I SAM-dependent methyltransferase n=1 Tax=Aspergillus karnatakaensis TaxID=1810916 RepID=UPI003CCDC17A